MKFDCDPFSLWSDARYKHVSRRAIALMTWHKHFAWLPVRLGDHDCRWLETVERIYTSAYVEKATWTERWVVRALIPSYRPMLWRS